MARRLTPIQAAARLAAALARQHDAQVAYDDAEAAAIMATEIANRAHDALRAAIGDTGGARADLIRYRSQEARP